MVEGHGVAFSMPKSVENVLALKGMNIYWFSDFYFSLKFDITEDRASCQIDIVILREAFKLRDIMNKVYTVGIHRTSYNDEIMTSIRS